MRDEPTDMAGGRVAMYGRRFAEPWARLPDDGRSGFLVERAELLQRFCTRVRKVWENPLVKALVR